MGAGVTTAASDITAFPLAWPIGRPRGTSRSRASFNHYGQPLTVANGLGRLQRELGLLNAQRLVVSTNIPVGRDGLPLSQRSNVADPGVAVYFQIKQVPHCISCDRWDRVADNIAAIAAHVEATRGQMRWGAADLAQAFAGFRALPAIVTPRPWWDVLGVVAHAPTDEIKARFKALAAQHHPDHGGDPALMAEVNAAWRAARDERAL